MNTSPRYRITYAISPEDYTRASVLIGREVSKRLSVRWVVIGSFFAICGVGFLAYLIFSKTVQVPVFYLLAAALFLIGVYNIIYYPLLYPRSMPGRAQRDYSKSGYLQKPVTLNFYSDCIEEESDNGENWLQWQAVKMVRETPSLYVIMFTRSGGIIIPKSQVPDGELEELDAILREGQEKFEKQRILYMED